MKKMIALSAAVVLTLASCGKKEEGANAEAVDTTTVVAEETVVDTVAAPEAATAVEVEAATSTEAAH